MTPASKVIDVVNPDEEEIYEVDPEGDLAAQDCWRCGDFPFTRQD